MQHVWPSHQVGNLIVKLKFRCGPSCLAVGRWGAQQRCFCRRGVQFSWAISGMSPVDLCHRCMCKDELQAVCCQQSIWQFAKNLPSKGRLRQSLRTRAPAYCTCRPPYPPTDTRHLRASFLAAHWAYTLTVRKIAFGAASARCRSNTCTFVSAV